MTQPPYPQPDSAGGRPAPPAGWPAQQPGPGWPGPYQQPAAPYQQPGPYPQHAPYQQPGPGGPQAYQPVGPGQPPVAPTAKRIPEDQPFVVRPSLGKRALTLGLVTLVVGLVLACPIGLAASSEGGGAGLLFIIPVVMLVFAVPVGLQLWLVSSGGPVLALGPAGLWIKTRPTRGQAIWLPWVAVERIYLRRWGLEKMLCVKPRDPRVGSGLGAFTAFDSGMQQAFFGTGFTATVNHADRSEDEIMRAVAGYAAGRCQVG
ncbi:hypothetical protein [Micromonospora sp. NPDC004551]|uniref:hypothetical protein n=1 Tax=Micromonospora sp. NPDC004551 TaxID=3154284 RepID=UPI0033A2CC0E